MSIMVAVENEESWPEEYFDRILISDDSFARLEQGALPPSPELS